MWGNDNVGYNSDYYCSGFVDDYDEDFDNGGDDCSSLGKSEDDDGDVDVDYGGAGDCSSLGNGVDDYVDDDDTVMIVSVIALIWRRVKWIWWWLWWW